MITISVDKNHTHDNNTESKCPTIVNSLYFYFLLFMIGFGNFMLVNGAFYFESQFCIGVAISFISFFFFWTFTILLFSQFSVFHFLVQKTLSFTCIYFSQSFCRNPILLSSSRICIVRHIQILVFFLRHLYISERLFSYSYKKSVAV